MVSIPVQYFECWVIYESVFLQLRLFFSSILSVYTYRPDVSRFGDLHVLLAICPVFFIYFLYVYEGLIYALMWRKAGGPLARARARARNFNKFNSIVIASHTYYLIRRMSSKSKPLPLSDTLRDLALLRVSDIELSSLIPSSTANKTENTDSNDVDLIVKRSYEFAQEARNAIKILNRGDVEMQGGKVESVRSQLEDVLKGLEQ